MEKLARLMYDVYCKSVGGKAFNGDQLPGSNEFFTDASKEKQANGWRDSANAAIGSIGTLVLQQKDK